jgi:hypothetical protein
MNRRIWRTNFRLKFLIRWTAMNQSARVIHEMSVHLHPFVLPVSKIIHPILELKLASHVCYVAFLESSSIVPFADTRSCVRSLVPQRNLPETPVVLLARAQSSDPWPVASGKRTNRGVLWLLFAVFALHLLAKISPLKCNPSL